MDDLKDTDLGSLYDSRREEFQNTIDEIEDLETWNKFKKIRSMNCEYSEKREVLSRIICDHA